MGAIWVRFYVAMILLFIISLVKSCNEVRYAISGTVVAPVRTTISGSGPPKVEYEFMDGQRRRIESDRPLFGVTPPVMIEYIPGSETSRIAGRSEWWWIIFPGIVLIPIGYHSWRFWKLYKS